MYEQGNLFFTTSPTSWKAKRIAAGSPLFINVGSKDGPLFIGDAELVPAGLTISSVPSTSANAV